ncbi:MAG: aminotransferase class I/II-fold pyridoxal phosphate-dependent enzyme [Alphaproteobacteria bacterium]|nr:aminotransferase class I/II-fold pyridoxal phosphate-dependent enzyme [Alphaproteobacteria bacterium]
MQDSTTRPPYMRSSVAAVAAGGNPTYAPALPRRMRALHLNECPFPPSPKVVEAVREAAARANRYPDAQARALAAALAARTGVDPACIVFGTGSEELLNLTTLLALDPGDEVIASTPSFGRYMKSTQLAGGVPVRVKLLPDGRNDVKALIAAITPRTRILYCALPNNPTGWINDRDEVEYLVTATPPGVLLAIDEAYFEYALHAGGPDVLAALKMRQGPWIVMRTFSKAYCLAGLRLGYALCSSPEVAGAIQRGRTAFNANALVQAAALAALEDEAHLKKVLDSCAAERDRLDAGLRRLGLAPMRTVTNFMSIPVPMKAAAVVKGMEERGILIGAWAEGGRDDVIRISIGGPEDTDAVLAAMAEILTAAPERRPSAQRAPA